MLFRSLAAARRYNALAREHGLTPTRMALAWCYTKWQTASTIIGVTTLAQLDEDVEAWGTTLAPELLAEIERQEREKAEREALEWAAAEVVDDDLSKGADET